MKDINLNKSEEGDKNEENLSGDLEFENIGAISENEDENIEITPSDIGSVEGEDDFNGIFGNTPVILDFEPDNDEDIASNSGVSACISEVDETGLNTGFDDFNNPTIPVCNPDNTTNPSEDNTVEDILDLLELEKDISNIDNEYSNIIKDINTDPEVCIGNKPYMNIVDYDESMEFLNKDTSEMTPKEYKEYIKFKEGKVVSVEDENLPFFIKTIKGIRKSIDELRDDEYRSKYKNYLKNTITYKHIMGAFLVFAILFCYLYYYTDIISIGGTTEPTDTTIGLGVSDSLINKNTGDSKSISSTDNADTTNQNIGEGEGKDKEREEEKGKSTGVLGIFTPKVPGQGTKSDENSYEVSDLAIVLQLGSDIGDKVYAYNISENSSFASYYKNRMNINTLSNNLAKAKDNKEELYLSLYSNKESFKDYADLYLALEERLELNIEKNKMITESFNSNISNNDMEILIDGYNKKDSKLKHFIDDIMIEILEKNNIEFKMVAHKLIYSIN